MSSQREPGMESHQEQAWGMGPGAGMGTGCGKRLGKSQRVKNKPPFPDKLFLWKRQRGVGNERNVEWVAGLGGDHQSDDHHTDDHQTF